MGKEKIRTCKYCKSKVMTKPGISNWKNLFRKPTLDEWITLFIIIMMIISAYVYKADVESITEFYTSGDYCNQQINLKQQETYNPQIDLGDSKDLTNFDLENG